MSARLLKCALYMGAGEVVVQKVGAVVGEAGHPTGDGKCDEETLTVRADLVVGADGAGSLTRSLLQQQARPLLLNMLSFYLASADVATVEDHSVTQNRLRHCIKQMSLCLVLLLHCLL